MTPPPRLILYIDGYCPRCRRIGRILSRLDVGRRLSIVSFRHDTGYVAYGISAEDLERRMCAVDVRSVRVYQGFAAARSLARTLPILWPLRPVLALASLLRVGDAVYDFLAARRLIIPHPGRCTDACDAPKPAPLTSPS